MRMRRAKRLTMPLLTCLALTSCAVGDFCDVVRGPLEFERPVSAVMVELNRPEAERITAQNAYGRNHCTW